MAKPQDAFNKRTNTVRKQQAKMAQGYSVVLDKNGIMKHRPKRINFNPGSLTVLFPLVAIFMAFKGFAVSKLGLETYVAHLSALQQGNVVDRVGAFLMGLDPLTIWVATNAAVGTV